MSRAAFAPLSPALVHRRPAPRAVAPVAQAARAIAGRPGLAEDARFFLGAYACGLTFFLALIA